MTRNSQIRLPLTQFRESILARVVAAFPEAQVSITSEGKIDFLHKDVHWTLSTGNYFAQYWAHGDLTRELDRFIATLQERSSSPLDVPSLDLVQNRLFPKLEREGILTAQRPPDRSPMIHEPFAANLVVTFVIDSEYTVQFIEDFQLKHWGISLPELSRIAYANLLAKTYETVPIGALKLGVPVLAVENLDGFAASRILCPEVLTGWFPAELRDDLLISIPNRDLLLVAPRKIEVVPVMNQMSIVGLSNRYALTSSVFRLHNGTLSVYGVGAL